MLRPQTRRFGLSLGDHACFALARHANLPALTGLRCSALGMGPNRPGRRYPSSTSSSANSLASASRSERSAWMNRPVSPRQDDNPCGQDTNRIHEEIYEFSAPVGNEPLRTLKHGAVHPG